MESKSQIFWGAVGKTLLWIFIHSLFGLSPIVITVLLKSFMPGIELSIQKIIHEGIILFFCSTISSVAMMDYMFSKVRFAKFIEAGLYIIPALMLLVSGLIFGQLYFHTDKSCDIPSLIIGQNVVIIFTFFYCLTLKTTLFIQEA